MIEEIKEQVLQPPRRRLLAYPSRDMLATLAFLAFTVARYIQLGARRDILATVRFEFLLGLGACILVGYQAFQRPSHVGRARPVMLFIFFLFVAIIIQVPFAADPIVAQNVFKDRVVKFAFLTFLMAIMIESPRQLKFFHGGVSVFHFLRNSRSCSGLNQWWIGLAKPGHHEASWRGADIPAPQQLGRGGHGGGALCGFRFSSPQAVVAETGSVRGCRYNH